MTSKEALEGLIDAYISWRAFQTRECIENDYRYKKLLKDLDRLEKLEKKHKNYALKIINAIRKHLCKQDEDYEREIISPKFLSDYLDLLFSDDFESEVSNDDK